MSTTTELTEQYIAEHQSIKDCLKKGLINYSALSRRIGKAIEQDKKSKPEAILIAARRYKEKLAKMEGDEKVLNLFHNSSLEIKNRITTLIIDKNLLSESLIEIEKEIKKERGLFFAIEGTKSITLIVQDQHAIKLESKFKHNLVTKKEQLSLITITSSGIGVTKGAVSFLSGLFYEHGINIEEFMSCHEDTLVVIRSSDVVKAMQFLKF